VGVQKKTRQKNDKEDKELRVQRASSIEDRSRSFGTKNKKKTGVATDWDVESKRLGKGDRRSGRRRSSFSLGGAGGLPVRRELETAKRGRGRPTRWGWPAR